MNLDAIKYSFKVYMRYIEKHPLFGIKDGFDKYIGLVLAKEFDTYFEAVNRYAVEDLNNDDAIVGFMIDIHKLFCIMRCGSYDEYGLVINKVETYLRKFKDRYGRYFLTKVTVKDSNTIRRVFNSFIDSTESAKVTSVSCCLDSFPNSILSAESNLFTVTLHNENCGGNTFISVGNVKYSISDIRSSFEYPNWEQEFKEYCYPDQSNCMFTDYEILPIPVESYWVSARDINGRNVMPNSQKIYCGFNKWSDNVRRLVEGADYYTSIYRASDNTSDADTVDYIIYRILYSLQSKVESLSDTISNLETMCKRGDGIFRNGCCEVNTFSPTGNYLEDILAFNFRGCTVSQLVEVGNNHYTVKCDGICIYNYKTPTPTIVISRDDNSNQVYCNVPIFPRV